jgi:GT2 family glycosyltransferase
MRPGTDIVAANAFVGEDGRYFPGHPEVSWPRRADVLRGNPVILSTAVVRRDLLTSVGGFPEDRWMRCEDYALWLACADVGARMAVLGEPLVRYAREGDEHLSSRAVMNQWTIARLFWKRWRAHPHDRALRRAAISKASYALTVSRDGLRRGL